MLEAKSPPRSSKIGIKDITKTIIYFPNVVPAQAPNRPIINEVILSVIFEVPLSIFYYIIYFICIFPKKERRMILLSKSVSLSLYVIYIV